MAFAGTPADIFNGATITWTDVTDYVRLSDTVTFSRAGRRKICRSPPGGCRCCSTTTTASSPTATRTCCISYLATLYGSYTALAAAFPTYGVMDDFTPASVSPIRVTHVASATVLWTGTIDLLTCRGLPGTAL